MRDDAHGNLKLVGRVVDAGGNPAATVEVSLRPGDETAKTDANGEFEFHGLSSRRYWISARCGDFYAGPTAVRVVDSLDPVHLELRRGATLVVHVIADGTPVAGATLALERDGIAATTDANGVATIRGLSPEYHDGRVRADGWAPAFVGMHLDPDPGGVIERHVVLRPGARIEGVVRGPGDVPVPDTEIVLWHAIEGRYINGATSCADGTWHIDALEAGRFRLVASSSKYRSADEQILECDGRTPQRDVVVRVDVAAEVSGIVVDTDGAPVPGAHVDVMLYHAMSTRTVADEQGRFEVGGLEPGEYYVDACTPTRASAAAHLHLQRGKPADLKLVVDDARIAGIVVDDKGEPVANATVRALAREIYVPYRLEELTDSRGRFDLGPRQLGEYDLRVSWPDVRQRHDQTPAMRVRSGDSDVRIVLEPTAMITGRVILNGNPVSYFGASLIGEHDAPNEIGIRDDDGRFSLRVPAGTWRLRLLAPGTALFVKADLIVERGQIMDLGDIAMPVGQRIAGHVRDANGSPVSNARVRIGSGNEAIYGGMPELKRWFQGEYETTTDETGAYVFAGIAMTEWTWRWNRMLSALHPARGASLVMVLPEGDSIVDLVLLSAGSIDGIVEGAAGRHRFVDAVRSDEPPRARWTSTRGDFRFDDVPAGEYEIVLHAPNDPDDRSSVRAIVRPGHCTQVKLVMVDSSVQLTIVVPRGREEDLVIERADSSEGVRESWSTLIMEGRVVFDEVKPGRYRVSLDGQNWFPITVVAADPPEQTVLFPAQDER